jgi:hypothetical protein
MNRSAFAWGLALSTVVLAQAQADPDPDCPPQREETAALNALLKQAPEVLALETARAGRIEFMLVLGYTGTLPGLSPATLECLGPLDTRTVPGTSDVVCTEEMAALQQPARDFAKRYNQRLLALTAPSCERRTSADR